MNSPSRRTTADPITFFKASSSESGAACRSTISAPARRISFARTVSADLAYLTLKLKTLTAGPAGLGARRPRPRLSPIRGNSKTRIASACSVRSFRGPQMTSAATTKGSGRANPTRGRYMAASVTHHCSPMYRKARAIAARAAGYPMAQATVPARAKRPIRPGDCLSVRASIPKEYRTEIRTPSPAPG